MKKLVLLLLMAIATFANAQTSGNGYNASYSQTFTTTTSSIALFQNNKMLYQQLAWTVSGTVASCTLALDTSPDGTTWSAGGAITGQTCTSAGNSSVTAAQAAFVRLTVTALSGSGATLNATMTGWSYNPSGTGGSGNVVGSGSQTPNTFPIWTSSNALGQSISGVNAIYTPGSAAIRRNGVAPIDLWQGDNGGDYWGIDSVNSTPDRDLASGRNEGLWNLPLAATDSLFMLANYPTSTLNGSVSAGATSLVTAAALTMGSAISGSQYVLLGTNTLGNQEVCIVTSGGGTTTLTLGNCEDNTHNIQAGVIYAHASGVLISVLNALYSHPVWGVNVAGASMNTNFSLQVAGDSTNQTGLGQVQIIDATSQTQDALQIVTNGGVYHEYITGTGGHGIGSSRNNPAVVNDVVTNGTTTITSATANFSNEYDSLRTVSGTNIVAGSYIASVTNSTTAVLNIAASGSGTGGSLTRYRCGFCVDDRTSSLPGFQWNPDTQSAWFSNSLCVGAGCTPTNSTGNLRILQTGTANVVFYMATASQANFTCTALGSGNDWMQCYTNNRAFHLGTNSADAIVIDTSQNTGLAAHLNQTAAGKFGNSCSMSTSTTCTFSLAVAYTTPMCIPSAQSTNAIVIAGECSCSSTTCTITAATANSYLWGAIVFGNPN